MHDAANLSQLALFVSLNHVLGIIVFLAVIDQDACLNLQFRNEGLHPHVSGSNDRCAVLAEAAAHLDTVRSVGFVGADAHANEVFVEHLGDDAIEHGLVVGGHDESVQHRLDAVLRDDEAGRQ